METADKSEHNIQVGKKYKKFNMRYPVKSLKILLKNEHVKSLDISRYFIYKLKIFQNFSNFTFFSLVRIMSKKAMFRKFCPLNATRRK